MKTKTRKTDFETMYKSYLTVYGISKVHKNFNEMPDLDLKRFVELCSFHPEGKSPREIVQEMKERKLLNKGKVEFLEKEF